MKRILILTIVCLIGSVVYSQDRDCYDNLLSKGITEYNNGNYEVAKKKWRGALGCPDLTSTQRQTLNDWIAKCITPSVVDLPKMVFVEGGSFNMGSNDADDEKPIHSVTLSSFYIGKYEVTLKQWREVMGSDPPELASNEGCDNCPVARVPWDDIQAFLQKLSDKTTGKKYRLPTEAEWEFAARGGNQSKSYKYSGSNTCENVAWFDNNPDNYSDNKTHVVGTKQANELGIFDMSGNVWEFCSDWYAKDYYQNSPTRNPTGAPLGHRRVVRGVLWRNDDFFCRVSSRFSTYSSGSRHVGFRVARDN
jgi:formylglycine-generating enzyme